ncbi:MAG TPA: 5-formyltetrahydrofolate cyclo-ligase [Dissulfurispiraceae bacterium]|nr:5-formyltetrahydrofolate cyclo-ligase [Dissulfurispiraceae bacterium]
MPPVDILKQKAELRAHMRGLRDSISPEKRHEKSSAIARLLVLLPAYREAASILLYASFGAEAETWQLIQDSFAMGKRVALPRVDKAQKKLLVYQIQDVADLVPGSFGIREPSPAVNVPLMPEEIDLVLVPGIAFDVTGLRIGFGGGFYDRLLAEFAAPSAGLCYEEQIVAHIPREAHDHNVQYLVTDKRIINCHGYKKD